MTTFRLFRLNDHPLEFEGTLLADTTSRKSPHQMRWMEVRIYSTTSSKYVVEVVGCTTVEDEINYPTITVANTPKEVRSALARRQGGDYMTLTAAEALEIASQYDDGLASIVERI